jgi:hypothetical protein
MIFRPHQEIGKTIYIEINEIQKLIAMVVDKIKIVLDCCLVKNSRIKIFYNFKEIVDSQIT